jgi:predicted PolB exonuclease-like 3'-5' exonuclease
VFDRPLAAFDIETIPDPGIGRRVLGLTGDDDAVVREMIRLRLEETDNRSEYPQLPFHRVVTIGVAWLDPASKRFKLGTLGGAAMDERSHLEGFAGLFRKAKRPRLVSWNGGGFDLPVIRYRSMMHGVAAPELHDRSGDAKWNNYQNRYHDLHVDLMDQLSGYGASRFVGLGRMCELLDMPGKDFVTGEVYEHILRGEDKTVEEYCKLDCLDTLLAFLSWTIHTGDLDPEGLQAHMALIREGLAGEEDERWQGISAALEGWPRTPEAPGVDDSDA